MGPGHWMSRFAAYADQHWLVIFFIPLVIYMANFRHLGSGDTTAIILSAIQLANEGTIYLDGVDQYFDYGDVPYFLANEDGRMVSNYPYFPAVMMQPLFFPLFGTGLFAEQDFVLVWDYAAKLCAALYTAGAVLLTYLTFRELMRPVEALTLAFAYGFGTALWPIASQSMWQHTGTIFWWSVMLYGLVRLENRAEGRTKVWLLLAGLAAGLAVWCRINNVLGAGWLGLVLLVRYRWNALWALVPMGFCTLGVMGFNEAIYGNWRGGVANVLEMRHWLDNVHGPVWSTPFWEGLAGLLISPSRGIFIFSPFLLCALWGAWSIWQRPEPGWRGLAWMLPVAALMLGILSKYIVWWGGIMHYGPRYQIDAYPFILIGLAAVWPRLFQHQWLRWVLLVVVLYSVWVQWVGAFCYPGQWAVDPVSLSDDKARLWDWGYNQIWDSFRSGVKWPLARLFP